MGLKSALESEKELLSLTPNESCKRGTATINYFLPRLFVITSCSTVCLAHRR
jgi:hypothetical protein